MPVERSDIECIEVPSLTLALEGRWIPLIVPLIV